MSFCLAYDEQVSFYAVAPPVDLLNPGYGVEVSTQVGQRTVFSLNSQLSAPDSSDSRQLQFNAAVHLLYHAELQTQWYPMLSVQWQVEPNRLGGWLGAGFARELLPWAGFFADTQWQPGSANFQTRFGLRLWLTRFNNLDARVRSAKPQGAIFLANPATNMEPLPEVSLSATTQPRPAVVSKVAPVPSSTTQVTQPPSVTEAISVVPVTAQPQLAAGWYVHLGLFQQPETLLALKDDVRLRRHQAQMVSWYDTDRAAHRLLIGPVTQELANEISAQLKQTGLENFLYKRDTAQK